MLKHELHSGNIFRIAEAVRDLAWRNERKRKWTTHGKRLYDQGMRLLAGEIAGT
jgi:RNA polymerase-interacting CarD/CdnL/TRCF family regulator